MLISIQLVLAREIRVKETLYLDSRDPAPWCELKYLLVDGRMVAPGVGHLRN
jgi:hypothetical protein